MWQVEPTEQRIYRTKIWICKQEKSGYRGSTWASEQGYEPKMIRGQYFWQPPFQYIF